jgi:hypothetical protein
VVCLSGRAWAYVCVARRAQVVLNNFSDQERKLQLMAALFQNMFPAIQLAEVRLSDTRRVVLFQYDRETDRVDVRHYLIRVANVGISKRWGRGAAPGYAGGHTERTRSARMGCGGGAGQH